MVERVVVRRETETIGQYDVGRNDTAGTVEIDQVEVAGDLLPLLEHRTAKRTRIDPPGGVGSEIVVAEVAVVQVPVKQHDGVTAGKALERDVATANDHAVVLVQRHAADAPPIGEDRRDTPVQAETIHPAIVDIAEDQSPVRHPDRAFNQGVTVGQTFHLLSPGSQTFRAG